MTLKKKSDRSSFTHHRMAQYAPMHRVRGMMVGAAAEIVELDTKRIVNYFSLIIKFESKYWRNHSHHYSMDRILQ